MAQPKNIPYMRVGNEIFEIKDLTAREHLVEVRDSQPTSPDNKVWIKETEEEVQVPTYKEFQQFYQKYLELKARVDRLDPQGS